SLRRDLDDRRLQWSGACALAPLTLGLRGQWQRRTLDVSVVGATRAPVSIRSDVTTLEMLGRCAARRWTGRAGLSGLASVSDSRGTDPPVPDAPVLSGRAYRGGRARLGRRTGTAGGR